MGDPAQRKPQPSQPLSRHTPARDARCTSNISDSASGEQSSRQSLCLRRLFSQPVDREACRVHSSRESRYSFMYSAGLNPNFRTCLALHSGHSCTCGFFLPAAISGAEVLRGSGSTCPPGITSSVTSVLTERVALSTGCFTVLTGVGTVFTLSSSSRTSANFPRHLKTTDGGCSTHRHHGLPPSLLTSRLSLVPEPAHSSQERVLSVRIRDCRVALYTLWSALE